MRRTRNKSLEPITLDQLKKLLKILSHNEKPQNNNFKFRARRNSFCIKFQFMLGLRPKECYDAKVDYINLKKKLFYIPAESNKQRYQDYMIIPKSMIPQLKNYLEFRKKFFKNSPWLFPTRTDHGRIGRTHHARIFRDALKKSGLYKVSYVDSQGLNRGNLHLYSLRAGFGNYVYLKTRDIKKTAIALRHRDLMMRTAWKYIRIDERAERKKIISNVFD